MAFYTPPLHQAPNPVTNKRALPSASQACSERVASATVLEASWNLVTTYNWAVRTLVLLGIAYIKPARECILGGISPVISGS